MKLLFSEALHFYIIEKKNIETKDKHFHLDGLTH